LEVNDKIDNYKTAGQTDNTTSPTVENIENITPQKIYSMSSE
jgi:hypothetical protein